jgi:hypothetical protein
VRVGRADSGEVPNDGHDSNATGPRGGFSRCCHDGGARPLIINSNHKAAIGSSLGWRYERVGLDIAQAQRAQVVAEVAGIQQRRLAAPRALAEPDQASPSQ